MKELEKKGSAVGVPARREEVTEILNEAFARNVIELEELEERLGAVQDARYLEELNKLIADLPDLIPPPNESPIIKPYTHKIILGTRKLSGEWLSARDAEIKVILGSLTLDFRTLSLPPGMTTINLSVVMSTLFLVVPPGLRLKHNIRDILSTVQTDELVNRVKNTSEAVLHLKGSCILSTFLINVK